MSRLTALAVLFAVVGAPVLALDRALDARAAMPCCEGDPCAQEVGQARGCCTLSPAAPDESPALKVERAAPRFLVASSAVPAPASLAVVSRVPAVLPVAFDTSPSRPVVLRL